jgi:hypothetical protein
MNGQFYSRIAALTLAALVAGATVAAERVYKWVDKDGVVHYGQQPPPEAQAEAIEVQKGYSTPADDEVKEGTEAEKEAARNAAYCKTATENFDALKSSREITHKDQYGTVHTLTAEERAVESDRAKAAMDKFCKPTAAAKAPETQPAPGP